MTSLIASTRGACAPRNRAATFPSHIPALYCSAGIAEEDYLVSEMLIAVARTHADSVLPLRIFFSICLALVLFSGLYIFRIRKRLFDRDPEVTADHWAARNLRLWQVILVWVLAVELLVAMLWRL
jgi:hypothetical protein